MKKEKYEPKYAYHYTSIGAFYNIIKKKELWLTNTATMNDKEEIRLFIKNLEKALYEELSDRTEAIEMFFNKVYTRLEKEYPYAFCMSTLSDDASQWERYADNAQGVCIKCNIEKLIGLLNHDSLCAIPRQIYYNYNIKEHDYYKLFCGYFKNNCCEDIFKNEAFQDEDGRIDNLLACSYGFKHKSFKSEEEIRIITLWDKKPKNSCIESECKGNNIKSMLKIKIEDDYQVEDIFEEITIGPRSSQNEEMLKQFLIENGFNKLANNVKESESPLR